MIDIARPKNLFLLDGIGAIASIIMLGEVLVVLQPYVGIPKSTLYLLAAIPVFFLLFDIYSYVAKPVYDKRNLKIIASLNSMYCCLSLIMVVYHKDVVTLLGWLYIIAEILIIAYIVFIELKTAK